MTRQPGRSRPAAGFRALLLAWGALSAACAPLEGIRDLFDGGARMARTVTITRDSWGVPHIDATTDAGVVFGMGYAQAEDNFWQLEEDYISALGRAASVYGDAALGNDLVRAAFEVERYAREEYAREPAERRALWDAYAAGINHFLSVHRAVRPRAIRRFEPWFPFALARNVWASSVINGVPVRDVVATPVEARTTNAPADASAPPMRTTWRPPTSALFGESPPAASNAWAAGPSRTRDGAALLFLNPHVDFFGNGQRWEMHLRSATGWHFAGFAVLGMPVPHSGHNEALGWTHTSTMADVADAWVEAFDHPTDPLAYRHGEDWPRAIEFEKTIDVRSDAGIERRRYRFLRTHRGPVVALTDGRRASIRIARHDDGGAIQQWLAMSRAASFDGFRSALAMTALPGSNTMYADTAGNIHYLHGNAVPRRDRGADWTAPLDGADPGLDWAGYHSPDELPHLTNPASGWIQNTNSSPFSATDGDDNPDPADHREYMAPETDNARSRASRRVLRREAPWTFGEWQMAAFDAYVHEAEIAVPRIADEWERLGAHDPERARHLDDAIDELRNWSFTSTIGSHAMTVFAAWAERFDNAGAPQGEWPYVRALEQAVSDVEAEWGTWRVAWGQVNRLQRVHTSGTEPFDTVSPSLPVPGGPGSLGIVFNFDTRPGADGRIGYGVRGHSWVGAIEFGHPIRARTIVNFGQSADSISPHWFDQAPYYARGEMKTLWFTRDDVEAAVALRYRPGEEPHARR